MKQNHGPRLIDKSDLIEWGISIMTPLLNAQQDHPHWATRTGAVYSEPGMRLEAWARPLWFLAPLAAGGQPEFTEIYLRGLEKGPDPESSEFWGWPAHKDQRFVEMAAIAFALKTAPQWLVEPLSLTARKRLASWLGIINDRNIRTCNWLFFRLLVNEALPVLGAKPHKERVKEDWSALEKLAVGEGWFEDGVGCLCDHYNGFAFHFYGQILAAWGKEKNPERSARWREQAVDFAQSYQWWFDQTGACIPYGRSMIYRFGMAAFWAASAYTKNEVLPLPQVKGMLLRHLRWWQETLANTDTQLLDLGFAYPNQNMTETYNAPGSPYWASKGLIVAGLVGEGEFWQAQEEPLPDCQGEPHLQGGGRILVRRETPAHAVLLSAGQSIDVDIRNFAAKYSRLAYSSRLGYSVPLGYDSLEAVSPDSAIFVRVADGCWLERGKITKGKVGTNSVESEWKPIRGVCIRTRLEFCPGGHRRWYSIETDTTIEWAEGGFAIPRGPETLEGLKWNLHPEIVRKIRPGRAEVANKSFRSVLHDISPEGAPERMGEVIEPWPNTNLLHPLTIVPILRCTLPPGRCTFCTMVAVEVPAS